MVEPMRPICTLIGAFLAGYTSMAVVAAFDAPGWVTAVVGAVCAWVLLLLVERRYVMYRVEQRRADREQHRADAGATVHAVPPHRWFDRAG